MKTTATGQLPGHYQTGLLRIKFPAYAVGSPHFLVLSVYSSICATVACRLSIALYMYYVLLDYDTLFVGIDTRAVTQRIRESGTMLGKVRELLYDKSPPKF